MGRMNKVLLDAPVGGGGGAVPYLSIDELLKRTRQAAPVPAQSTGSGDSMGAAQ
jgi:hypothetical protein